MTDLEKQIVFQKIYQNHVWQGLSKSGPGSDPHKSMPYLQALQRLINDSNLNIRTIIDLGCGDWSLSSRIKWEVDSYIGVEIVPELVNHLNQNFSANHISFLCADFIEDKLPTADLLIIKDALQHLPNNSILKFLNQVLPKYRLALITNVGIFNSNIQTGDWRPIRLLEDPFSLKAKELLFYDLRIARRTIDRKQVLLWINEDFVS